MIYTDDKDRSCSGRKLLFTTPVSKIPDYFGISISRPFRPCLPTPSFGLRFLAENVPQVAVLEYPSWKAFTRALQGCDVLGLSFYMKDIPVVQRMVKIARDAGIREIWGGNYGVLCDEARDLFDRSFKGYAEEDIYQLLNGRKLEKISHPLLDTVIGVRWLPLKMKYGFLFTSRGCSYRCTFCQTVPFAGPSCVLSLEAIETALRRYRDAGVTFLFIMDENFMFYKEHSWAVIDLLSRYGFAWGVCTRAGNLAGNVSRMREKGFVDCIIGLESLRNENLRLIEKKADNVELATVIKELNWNNIYIHATYMIGYESDTVHSIKEDMRVLKTLGIDSYQIGVLTPFPHTPLWDYLSAYGLSSDYGRYDGYHLAWNHPRISYDEMDRLLAWCKREVFSAANVVRGLRKLYMNGLLERSPIVL